MSGRKLPEQGEEVRRDEGVGIVLSRDAAEAWTEGGQQWRAVSPRIVTARLKVVRKKQLTLVSVYAPTFRASVSDKESFFHDLQLVIDGMASDDILVVMGDWNACVESIGGDSLWDGALGRHGVGAMNEAGLSLMSFCVLNELSVMNTMFEKKDIYKFVAAPRHQNLALVLIIIILMRQGQRRRCQDVQVMRGAECFTDHRLLRAKIQIDGKILGRKRAREPTSPKHLDVLMLKNEDTCKAFNARMEEQLGKEWPTCTGVRKKWEALVKVTKKVATQVFPVKGKRSADWFHENEGRIRHSIEKRNLLLRSWLSSSADEVRREYVLLKSKVQRLIRIAKNETSG